ncbi:MAG: helix-turn-helix domain-containing protein [Pseudomonadota bacterium]
MVQKRRSGRKTPAAPAPQTSRTAQRRERERQARHDLICDAATRVFARHGYGASSMEQVAQEAALGKATLYYYFRTKRELFGAILSREHVALAELSRQHLDAGADALATARAICLHWVSHFEAHPDLATLMLPIMASGMSRLKAELGDEVATQVRAAHQPLMAALATLSPSRQRGPALTSLISTLVLGLVARAAGGQSQGAAHDIEMFFDLVEPALARTRK